MQRIKYHFALTSKGQIIDIADVTENDRLTKYYCLNCGDEMRPRLGKKNAHHFAHISTTPDCNPETYLHKLAKLKIKEKFESTVPFEISLSQSTQCSSKKSCPFYKEDECTTYHYTTYDLHKIYDDCKEEQSIRNFRADLLLTSSTKPSTPPILIEVFVTHKCEERKINSEERIIEVTIKDDEDISKLLKSSIVESAQYPLDEDFIKCTFYNFKRTTADAKLEKRSIPKFYLFESGAAHITDLNCNNVLKKDTPKAILELAIDDPHNNPLFKELTYELGYAKAIEMGHTIKNCHLCKYLKYRIEDVVEPFICCLYKKYDTPQYPKGSEANNCSYFRKDHKNDELLKLALKTATILECK